MCIDKLIELLDKSHSSFHVVNLVKELLVSKGFEEINEFDSFDIKLDSKYFVVRNDSSIIAFKTPKNLENYHFQIAASHTDSPTFKLKQNPIVKTVEGSSLNVEPYGGMIMSSWFDKSLSIAGRVVVKDQNSVKTMFLDIEKDLLVIPNVAIHMNRDINSGFKYNPAVDTLPLISTDDVDFKTLLQNELKFDGEILSHDLYLYSRENAKLCGLNKEFLMSPRIDNLTSVYSSLCGLIHAENNDSLQVLAAFDNEEVGSRTRQGAGSTFLQDILVRVSKSLGIKKEQYHQAVAKSSVLSVDNGHAIHPNHPELSDKNKVYLNKGILIKYNASETYTSNALSSSIVKYLAAENNIPTQDFENRSDMRGGSTLGNISTAQVSALTVDIGLPQLAMHSSTELCAIEDIKNMTKLIKSYFNASITVKNGSIYFN